MAYCIKFQCAFNCCTCFCDQSNLIWKEFENVVFDMSEDAKLYGDVDFKQSYFTCGVTSP